MGWRGVADELVKALQERFRKRAPAPPGRLASSAEAGRAQAARAARGWSPAPGFSEQLLLPTAVQSGVLCESACACFPPRRALSLGDKTEHEECHSKAITSKMHNGSAGEHGIWPRAAPCEN